MSSVPRKWTGSLCWYCRNAYDACSWSRRGVPVEGWEALRNDLPPKTEHGPPVMSFFVLRCPAFALEGRFQREYSRFLLRTGRDGRQCG